MNLEVFRLIELIYFQEDPHFDKLFVPNNCEFLTSYGVGIKRSANVLPCFQQTIDSHMLALLGVSKDPSPALTFQRRKIVKLTSAYVSLLR